MMLEHRLIGRAGALDGIEFSKPPHSKFADRVEDGVGNRADMRVNPSQITQNVEVKRCGLYCLRTALAQTIEVPLSGSELQIAQRAFLDQKLAGFIRVSRHEDAERDPQ